MHTGVEAYQAALRWRRSCPIAPLASRQTSRSPFRANRVRLSVKLARISLTSRCASSGSVLTNCHDLSNAVSTKAMILGSRFAVQVTDISIPPAKIFLFVSHAEAWPSSTQVDGATPKYCCTAHRYSEFTPVFHLRLPPGRSTTIQRSM